MNRAPSRPGASMAAMIGHLLRSWMRNPIMIIQTLVFPAMLLIMFDVVFGKTMGGAGGDSIAGTTALIALVGVMQGGLVTAVYLIRDRESGLLDRLWTQPARRWTLLGSRLVAEMIRGLVSTAVLLVVGVAMGLRPEGGPLPLLGALILPTLFGAACSTMLVALTIRGSEKAALQTFSGLFLVLLFLNTGFAPAENYDDWLRPFIEHQPMSPAIDACRALYGGTVDWPATFEALAWIAGMLVVFGWLAVRGMRSVIGRR